MDDQTGSVHRYQLIHRSDVQKYMKGCQPLPSSTHRILSVFRLAMFFFSSCAAALAVTSQATALSWEQPRGVQQYGTFFGLPGQNATYDYVVVGGGTAGLTVASRLAENRSLSVAVVEPGTFSEISNGNNSQVPAYSYSSVSGDGEYVNPWIDWELNTVPQPVSILHRSDVPSLYDPMLHHAHVWILATAREHPFVRSRQRPRW